MNYFYFFLITFILSGCGERKVLISSNAPDKKKEFKQAQQINYQFHANEWQINSNCNVIGSPKAVKGGTVSIPISDFPPTYRTIGKDTRLMILSLLEGLTYETLLSFDAQTLKYTSSLASHWKISEDKQTYLFRMNKDARFADGTPVTAYDVVATFKLLTDKGIQDPSINAFYQNTFNLPIALDKDTVKITCKKASWRNFLYFSSMAILPHKYLDKIDGESFIRKYKYFMLPGSGPYQLNYKKTRKGQKLVLSKRNNYWAENTPANQGLNNFQEIKFVVIRDERLKLEKFKKAELDLYIVGRAKWWVEDLDTSYYLPLKNRQILKKKVFNYKPLGLSGLAFNTLEFPFNDLKVRKAFTMLWNVDQLIEKLFYNEYVRSRSFFQGTVYENKENKVIRYNPDQALQLLNDAGWKKHPDSEWLVKNNKIFEIDFAVESQLNKIFTPFQHDLQKIGIKLNLINMTSQAIFEKVMKRKFQITYIGWTGLLFPNPESSMHSKYAKQNETNNITGISLNEVDNICEEYNEIYDVSKRVELLQKLDKILVENCYYALGWVAPYSLRVAFWNKFGMPESGLSYAGDWRSILTLWWIDPLKQQTLHKSKKNNAPLPPEKELIDFWGKIKS